jgi:hypothetical protein
MSNWRDRILKQYATHPVVVAASAVMLLGAADAPTDVRLLLERAGRYVLDYHDSLTTLVADEVYVQRLRDGRTGTTTERTLRSQFAIARGESDDGWFAIRDIRDVDGAVAGERSKVEALLEAPRSRLRAVAFALAAEQSKYNLGRVYRTINVPILPLLFLLPDRQPRFRFRAVGEDEISGIPVTVLSYEERDRPTIIRTPTGRSVVARGKLWVDPSNGAVRKTELLTNEPRGLRAVISVSYERDARLELLVPMAMHESYVTADEEITASATYSNFRRFETDTRIVR